MIIRLALVVLALALISPYALSQDAAAQTNPAAPTNIVLPESYHPSTFAETASSAAKFQVKTVGKSADEAASTQFLVGDDCEAALRYLLKSADPVQTAAEILKVPADRIVLVPEIYWNEPKWQDWARKADEARKSKPNYEPKVGPDEKIPLQAEVTFSGSA